MRLIQKIGIAAGGLVFAGTLAYGELVLDWRTPRSQQRIDFALTGSAAFEMADYDHLRNDMKRKYGEHVSISVPVTGVRRRQDRDRRGQSGRKGSGNAFAAETEQRHRDVHRQP